MHDCVEDHAILVKLSARCYCTSCKRQSLFDENFVLDRSAVWQLASKYLAAMELECWAQELESLLLHALLIEHWLPNML